MAAALETVACQPPGTHLCVVQQVAAQASQIDRLFANQIVGHQPEDRAKMVLTKPSNNGLEFSLPRNLSSPSRTVREKALEALGCWLSSCKQVDESDIRKVWEGILYCVWQTDRGGPLAELSGKITGYLGSLAPELAILNFKILLAAVVREWSGIEKRRLEKFRILLRDCLSQILRVLKASGWDQNHIVKFAEALGECVSEEGQPTLHSVRIFLAQVFVEELRGAVPCVPETLKMLLEPFFTVFSTSSDRVVLQKIKDAVFLPLLRDARAASAKAESSGQEDNCLGSLVLGLQLAGKFFELAASPSVGAVSKKFLNQLYEDYSLSEKGFLDAKRLQRKLKRRSASTSPSPSSPSKCLASPIVGRVRIINEKMEEAENRSPDLDDAVPVEKAESTGVEVEEPPVSRSKRKRVDANGPHFEKRVLRSEQRLLNLHAQSTTARVNGKLCVDEQRNSGSSSVSGADDDSSSLSGPSRHTRNKRKRRCSSSEDASDKELLSGSEGGDGLSDYELQHTSKKVRFSLRNNLVWTPYRPLPPEWVRVPPSAAPRGSAMKPGVEPGPIQSPSLGKKAKGATKHTAGKSGSKKAKGKKLRGRKQKQRRNSV